jgi:5'-AMP-activated protein kinase catalytic alpha subunit
VAVKILEKEKIKEQADLERVAREINILKKLRHPNIIQLYEVSESSCGSYFSKIVETPRSLYLIMEFAEGGELFEYIVKS